MREMREVREVREVRGLLLVLLLCVLLQAVLGEVASYGYCVWNQCYVAFEDRGDFRSAQDKCSQQNGHLGTVLSSEDRDMVSKLLGNTTGQYWIGLHLPEGCPDPSTSLRGYQWVTSDTDGFFSNWAPVFDASCSSSLPRCVSVSKKNEFQWTQDECKKQASGFVCVFFDQHWCLALMDDGVFYLKTFDSRVDSESILPQGSMAVRSDGSRVMCEAGVWLQAPWGCEIQGGGCEYKCTIDPQDHPVCYCPPGHIVSPVNNVTCEAVAVDPCLPLKCEHACYKFSDSYLCTCHAGFVLVEDRCVDFDGECEDGYWRSGGVCVDRDECESAPCEHECVNTPGAYECSCYDGYKVDPNSPEKCKLHCGREECDAECDPNNKFQCYCPDGYVLDEGAGRSVCLDIDECVAFYCDQRCENSYGSYRCSCEQGYALVGGDKCEKIVTVGTEDTTAVTEDTTEVTEDTTEVTEAPTPRPSAVSAGGLAGIIVCTVFFILLAVFLIHYILCGVKTDSSWALKVPGGPEAHSLQQVTANPAS